MLKSITVVPAYGRDYKTGNDAIASWNAGRDFQAQGLHGGYISNDEAKDLGFNQVRIRYNKCTQLVVVDV